MTFDREDEIELQDEQIAIMQKYSDRFGVPFDEVLALFNYYFREFNDNFDIERKVDDKETFERIRSRWVLNKVKNYLEEHGNPKMIANAKERFEEWRAEQEEA